MMISYRFLLWISAICLIASNARSETAEERIDRRISETLKRTGLEPTPQLDDYAFARRLYLQILGRIPAQAELEAFVAAPDRDALIDTLLAHPLRVSHDYNFLADLLRVQDRIPGVASGFRPYENWLKQSLAENLPYDALVQSLIGAEGYIGENGAVGFYLRDRGMPLDHLANTLQTFLGTRMVCAQCHDHPFEEWTQMDFFKLAAFSAPVEVKSLPGEVSAGIAAVSGDSPVSLGAYVKPFRNSYVEETMTPVKLPHDYAYDDAHPGDTILPQTPFGELVKLEPGQSRQQAYASWLTGADNPRFAKVIANRLWKRAMGIGIVEPVDDLDSGTAVGDPELLDDLTALIIELDFDMLAFRRVLYRSDLFQREAVGYELDSGDRFAFPGPRQRRLAAEQIWDSVGILIREDFDEAFEIERLTESDHQLLRSYQLLVNSSDDEVSADRGRRADALIKSGVTSAHRAKARLETLIAENDSAGAEAWLEQLIADNERDLAELSEICGYGSGADPARRLANPFVTTRRGVAALAKGKFPALKDRYVDYFFRSAPEAKAKEAKKQAEIAESERLAKEHGRKMADAYRSKLKRQSRIEGIRRASELGNPAPDTHFIRELGQSDRMLISNSRLANTIPQLLVFRNGFLLDHLEQPETPLWQHAAEVESVEACLESIFLQMLSRPPTAEEQALLLPEFAESRAQGMKTTIWVLLNSVEFLVMP